MFTEKQSQRTGSVNLDILSSTSQMAKIWGGGHWKYHPVLRYVQTICTSEHTNGTFGFNKIQGVSVVELLKEDSAPHNV